MGNEVDYYDVQAMIRDARSEIRGEISAAKTESWREINDLREQVAETGIDLREEIDALRQQVESLERVLQSRTEHLA
jgi:polyhydroxyalkanoate synthesis regulator phasin